MANTTIGGILIRIGASTKELEYDLKRAEKALQKTASKFSELGNRLSIGLTLPIAAAGAASFKMASDFEESLNKVRVAFGSSSESVEQFASTTLKQFGIARGSALDMAALFGDMATSMGLPQGEAAKLSTSLVSLAGDLASFKNINISEAQTALSGVFTGETESLKRLGIVMLETNLNAFALTQGINKQVKEMTQAEKVALRYAYIMDVTKNAQGDFARTSGGAANQMRIFQESVKELGASFGTILLPAITPIISKINEWLQKFGQLSNETKTTIVVIAGLVAVVGPLLIVFSKVITAVGAIKIAMAGLAPTSTGLTSTLVAMGGPIAIGIAALAGAVYLLYKNWDYLNAESEVFRNSITAVKLVLDQVVNLVMLLANGIKALGKSWVLFIGALTGEINPVTALKGIINEFKTVGKEFGDSVVEGFKSAEVAAKLSRLSAITGIKSPSGDRAASYKKLSEKSKAADLPNAFSGLGSVGSDGGKTKPVVRELTFKVTNLESFKSGLGDLGLEIAKIDNLLKTGLIKDLDAVNEKTRVYEGAIKELIANGIDPFSTQILELQSELRKLNEVPINIEPLQRFGQTAKSIAESMKVSFSGNIATAFEDTIDLSKEFSAAISATLGGTFEYLGESLANALTGDAGFSNFFNGLIGIVADFMSTFGKQVVAIGVAKLGIEKLFQTGGAAGAIAAGVGLIVLGKVVKKLFSKPPSLNIGTDLVKKDGLAKIHRGEAIIPAAVVKSGGFTGGKGNSNIVVTGIIKGQDILLSNRYGQDTASRYR